MEYAYIISRVVSIQPIRTFNKKIKNAKVRILLIYLFLQLIMHVNALQKLITFIMQFRIYLTNLYFCKLNNFLIYCRILISYNFNKFLLYEIMCIEIILTMHGIEGK